MHTGGSANDDEAASDDGGEASEAPQQTASALTGQQPLKKTKRANFGLAFFPAMIRHTVSQTQFFICFFTVTHGLSISMPSSMRAPPSPQRRLGSSADSAAQSTFQSQSQSHTASQSHSSAPLPPHRGTSNVPHTGDAGSSAPIHVQGNRLKRTGAEVARHPQVVLSLCLHSCHVLFEACSQV